MDKSGRRDDLGALAAAPPPPGGRPFALLNADGFNGDAAALEAPAVRAALADAIFVPALMGNINLDSFRLSEALEVGALPLLPNGATAPHQRPRAVTDYWRSAYGRHAPLLVVAQPWRGPGGAADLVAALLQPERAVRLEAYHQALADWWVAYKHALRSAIARWMRATREAVSDGESK